MLKLVQQIQFTTTEKHEHGTILMQAPYQLKAVTTTALLNTNNGLAHMTVHERYEYTATFLI